MGFPRQEYWSGLPFPSPVYFPKPAVEPRSSALQAVSSIVGGFFTNWATRRASDQSNVLLHLELTADWLTSSKSYVLLLLLLLSRFSHVWLCDPIDGSPRGFPIPGILQARTVEWVAISFSSARKWKSQSEVTQSCLTLGDPMDCSLPGSSVHGIFQARVLEWGTIAFSQTAM